MAGGSAGHRFRGVRCLTLRVWSGASVATAVLVALALSRQRQVDFEVYRMGGRHLLGAGLYSSHVSAGADHLLFTYTPLAALLFWPVAHLPAAPGQVLWDLTDVAALTALVAVSVAAARGRSPQGSDWQLAVLALAPVGLLLWPVRYDLELGQVDIVLILMIVTDLTMRLSWGGRDLPRGLLLGTAAAIKLTPLIFLPFLVITGQWRAARNAAVTFSVATVAAGVIAPTASWRYFTAYAFDVRRIGDRTITNNQTLTAAMTRAGLAPSHLVVDLALAAVLGGGLVLSASAFRRSSPLLGVLVCAATGLLVSPISWQHHYVWCVPLLAWLACGVDRPRRDLAWAALAALVVMVVPPGQSAGTNPISYLRENAYVVAGVAFLSLTTAMLWTRSRSLSTGVREPSGIGPSAVPSR